MKTSGQRIKQVFLLFLLTLLLAACAPQQIDELPTAQIIVLDSPQFTITPSQPGTATPAPDPYLDYTIEALANRQYGKGELIILEPLTETPEFTRYLISFPSDNLVISGFIDIPQGEGPFPVVLVLHGYVDPVGYLVETYTEPYASAFAQAGFIAIHPNYRNYPPSDSGPNLFRTGFAVDVLNLTAVVRHTAGQPGALQLADGENVFLWGHSMGGGVAQRVITVGADINGAVLYASMSGDEQQNYEHILNVLSDGSRGFPELNVPEDALQRISPVYHYERISVPISIHHGNIDDVVPLEWSEDLCARLQELGKEVECFTYRNMPHTFYGLNNDNFIQRSIEFFLRNMR